ncbi:MAG: class I SAM-dependent methyltransferase [Thermodesulfobacteriota bacterium]|nr:class I SAM-dependent methyltransferase [Thermodesulfobacteriota bacterium]
MMMKETPKDLYESIWQEKLETGQEQTPNRIKEAFKETDSGRRCLDIGCGDGSFSKLVMGHYRHVCGIDFSAVALKHAALQGVSPVLADLDGQSLPFRHESFDLVSCLDVIEHVFDPEMLVQESYRVLKKGGVLILTTPNIRFIDHIRKLLMYGQFPKTSLDKGSYDGGHIHYFTFADIRHLLTTAGFRVLRQRGYDEKAYWTLKTLLFRLIMRWWEKDLRREFFCPGILFKVEK